MSCLQVETELDWDLLGKRTVVRVKYRRPPARRWTRLVVVPDEGQRIDEILAHAAEIAVLHESRAAAT